MALATLSIDLEAKLAQFAEGMDKAARLAEKNAAATEAAWTRAASRLTALSASVAGLFAGFSAVDAVRSAIDGLDALNDVMDATGASIETVGALEEVARQTGASMDVVTGALIKLNGQLTDLSPDSNAAKALRAIGLEAAELRKLDPGEALRRVAIALSGYADDGAKARVVQELFGKSTREVSAFLKDLAEKQDLVSKVTKEQTDAVDKFNKQLTAFQANLQNAQRAIVSDMLPSLNRLVAQLEAGTKVFGGFGAALAAIGLSNPLRTVDERVAEVGQLREALAKLQAEAANPPLLFNAQANQARQKGLQEQIDKQLKLIEYAKQVEALTAPPAADEPKSKVVEGALGGSGSASGELAQRTEKLTAAQRALNAYVNELEREAAKLSDVTEQQKLLNLLRLAGADRDPVGPGMAEYLEGLQRQITLRKQDAAISADNARIAKEREAAEKSLADELYRLSGRAERDRKAALLELLETQKAYGEYTEQELGAILDGLNGKAKETFNELDELSKQFARNIQDALGDTIEQTLAGDFDNIVRLWGNMLTKMASQAAAAELGRAIFGDGFFKQSGAGAGQLGGVLGNLAQYFGNQLPFALAQGGVVSQAGITRFASGGVFDSPTRFSYAGGRIGELGEAGPEAVMPLRRGRDGKLGVAATGGEAGPTVVINIASGVTRPELAALIPGLTQQIKAELRNDARRPGGSF